MSWMMDRLGVTLAGVLATAVVAVVAGAALAGPLDPTGSPGSTDGVKLPGTPISSAPITISQPGHYYLTRNLSASGATAITVTVADVSIDLGGFTLSGNGAPMAQGIDVSVGGSARVAVTNGNIRNFDVGIDMLGTADNYVTDVTLTSNNVGVSLGQATVLSDCLVAENVDGVFLTGPNNTIRDCNISANASRGIVVNNNVFSGLVARTSVLGNNTLNVVGGAGIWLDGERLTIRESSVAQNRQRDIRIDGNDVIVSDNVITCDFGISNQPGAVNNYAPVNSSTEPHTNRSHTTIC